MPRHAVRTGPQEGVDLVQDGAFAALQALVLAFVLLPGSDHERLLEQIAIGKVAAQMPVDRTGAAPGAP